MAHLLRGKQAGVPKDLSIGISPDSLKIDDIARLGISSPVSQIAYDPVQSLLAVGTVNGQIHVFGRSRVAVVFELRKNKDVAVDILQFCADKLLCLDSTGYLFVFSLETKKQVSSFSPPGKVTALHSDPTLDYALLGTQAGEIFAYDLDRESMAPFKLPNFWIQQNPRIRTAPIVSLQTHPRDVGSLLIGYTEGAVIYSFKQNLPTRSFLYEVPRGAPGGNSDPTAANISRWPKVTQALWHPTGTFILTGHDDGSIVIWDPKDGRIIMARTLTDTNVHKPGAAASSFDQKEDLSKIAWCANADPDDTCIVISGGGSLTFPTKGLTLLELGRTPNYATSSWQVLSDHFENPKRQRILPSPPNVKVTDFCLIPRKSPHFAGAQDPIAVIAILSPEKRTNAEPVKEIITLSFPSGLPISPTNQLHPSLTFVHPRVSAFHLASMDRNRWLGLTEKRQQGPLILQGGAEEKHVPKRFENRNVVQTAHLDGTVRLLDIGHGDEIENDALLQVDVCRAVGRFDKIEVSQMSLSGASAELAIGLRTGEVVAYRWLGNKTPGVEPQLRPNAPRQLTNVMDRRDPALLEGLHPLTLLDAQNGPVTSLKMADVGFLAAGFEGGDITVVDMRGPAIILNTNVSDFSQHDKKSAFRKSSHEKSSKTSWPTIIEFSVMTVDGDDYSSILMHVGTSSGHVATFKILPAGGTYTVQYAGLVNLDDSIIAIHPLHAELGKPAFASQNAVAGLRTGTRVNGVLVAVSHNGAKIFKPATQKGASKSWEDYLCDSAAVSRYEDLGYALVGLFGDGWARAFSIPALKEINAVKVSDVLDVRYFRDAKITATGDILGWTVGNRSELALINIWGAGLDLNRSKDIVYNPDIPVPPRPTISNFQWVSGTQYVTPLDLDLLIGGPDRPPSKKMIMQAREEERQRTIGGKPGARTGPPGQSDEGYWAYMQRQLNERTERLNIMGDSMNRLEDTSSNWADDVGKYVQKQKRNAVMGVMKGKFGF